MNLHLQQQFAERASRQAVWGFLMDAPEVGRCMPGVQTVEPLDDTSYRVRLAVGIGPVQAKLAGKVTIAEIDPPARMLVRIDWKDGATDSKVGAQAEIRLEALPGDGQTSVLVDGQLSVLGALGKYGQPIANKKAAEITEAFAANVRARLEGVPAVVTPVQVYWWQRAWRAAWSHGLQPAWGAIRRLWRRRSQAGPSAGPHSQ